MSSLRLLRPPRFHAKVLIPVVTVMVLLVGFLMWVLNYHFTHQLEPRVKSELRTSDLVLRNSLEIRERGLAKRYENIANESRVRAVAGQSAEKRTVRDFLKNDLLEELEADWVNLTDAKGAVVATATRDAQVAARDLEVAAAKASQEARGRGQAVVDTVVVGGKLFDVVAVPVAVDEGLAGALTFGDQMKRSVADELKALTQSEIVLVVEGQATISTVDRPGDYRLLAGLLRGSPGLPGAAEALTLGDGEHVVALAGALPNHAADGRTGYVLLRSLEPALQQLRVTQQWLLAAGMLGILVSTVTVWALVRRITQPLRELRDGAEAVGRGDFSRRVQVASQDECGELATAFNQMTENLESSRRKLEQTVETLRATQAQLVQSEKLSAIGQFTAGVAHELNNPLTAVIGFAELIGMSDPAKQHEEHLQHILGAGNRCKRIVQDLLGFARQHQPEQKPVALNELLRTTLRFLHYQLRTSNIEVVEELDADLPLVMADAHQMQQVFINLITNARQAMETAHGKGRLRVSTSLGEDKVRVHFQDDGPGIPPENLGRIFDPFFTTKGVGQGTGLGLSLCYGIVQGHHGAIGASSPPGEGATFTVELPAVAAPEPSAAGEDQRLLASAAGNEGAGKRVLVIDDEPALLHLIREILTLVGYQVDTAVDGESALERLAKQDYDFTLCDWKMPGLTGRQVCERVTALDRNAARHFIFMTGDIVNEGVQEFATAHGHTYLPKPFTLQHLRSVLQEMGLA